MKGLSALFVVAGVSVGVAAGYGLARTLNDRDVAKRESRVSAEQLSGITGIVYLLDSGDVDGVRVALLSMGSAQLDPIIQDWRNSANLDVEYLDSRCRAIVRLRELRQKHDFMSNDSDPLLAIAEIKEADASRRKFLESVQCEKR